MFVEFYGLTHNPFRARIRGSEVFLGPQQATVMSALKKALASSDAAASVTGPVGVGKTTVVSKAVNAFSSNQAIARIGRMRLGRDDVLELLLNEFDVSRQPTGTLQRFGAFQRLMKNWCDSHTRTLVVVEDARTVGVEALAELESLTSSDAGDTPGANIILMGQPDLDELLLAPPLARLRQRLRLRQSIAPFSVAEVRGYLAHRLRGAGGDLGTLFDADTIGIIHACSEGIPRVVNHLCEAALSAAADAKADRVTRGLLENVAREAFGFDVANAAAATPEPAATSTPVSAPASAAPSAPAPDAPPVTAPKSAGLPKPEPVTATARTELPDPVVVTAPPPPAAPRRTAGPDDDFEIPELIQDTQPELKALAEPEASPAEAIAAWREKTDATEPSLPVLTLPDPPAAAEAPAAAARTADELRVMLEPHAPEPLSKDADPADTQTIKALDSALRPDTQLLKALDEPGPDLANDDAPVPLGLQTPGQNPPPVDAAEQAPDTGTEKLPTLSASMRLHAPVGVDEPAADKGGRDRDPKKPDIDALEAALAVARKGPIDLDGDRDSSAASTPAAAAPPTTETPPRTEFPEITLDRSLHESQQEAQARRDEEAAKIAALAEQAKAAKAPSRPPKVDFGLDSIGRQLDSGDTLTRTPSPKPSGTRPDDAGDAGKDRDKLKRVAAKLGTATSLEEIDDMAAETLFGEEFSQIAAKVAAMAANDMPIDEEADSTAGEPTPAEPLDAADRQEATIEMALEPALEPADPASVEPATTVAGQSAVPTPPPETKFGEPDIDSSAARRLEMVRSLNQKKPKPVNAPPAQEIVLGEADAPAPAAAGPAPEPIENQFGTSMTATLNALSTQTVKAMQEAEERKEKKGGLLSRFKRS